MCRFSGVLFFFFFFDFLLGSEWQWSTDDGGFFLFCNYLFIVLAIVACCVCHSSHLALLPCHKMSCCSFLVGNTWAASFLQLHLLICSKRWWRVPGKVFFLLYYYFFILACHTYYVNVVVVCIVIWFWFSLISHLVSHIEKLIENCMHMNKFFFDFNLTQACTQTHARTHTHTHTHTRARACASPNSAEVLADAWHRGPADRSWSVSCMIVSRWSWRVSVWSVCFDWREAALPS